MNYNDFFSINASELQINNAWSNEYLNPQEYEVNNWLNAEYILIQREYKEFFDLASHTLFSNYYMTEIYPPKNNKIAEHLRDLVPIEHELGDLTIPFNFIQREPTELYAAYDSTEREILYYQKFYEAPNEIKQIVTIHERMHAFHHIHWPGFPNASVVYKEFLAQLFTFMAVRNTYLQHYFEELSEIQPDIYRTWKPYDFDFENEDVFKVFEDIKKGSLDNPFLNTLAAQYP